MTQGALNLMSTTSILHKGSTQKAVFDAAHSILAASPALTQPSGDVSLASFCPEGFRSALSIISSSGFAWPLDSNILTLAF